MTVGIALVIIGLLGIVLLPFSMMGGYRDEHWSTALASTTTTGTQYTGLLPTAISMDQAKAIADHFLDSLNNPELAVKEIMEFEYNFYVLFYEKSTGVGAFEMLIWKVDPSVSGFGMMGYSGSVVGRIMPEIGPNMMWNTKYGGMMGGGWGQGGGMMGPGMMGRGWRYQPYSGVPTANMSITKTDAKQLTQSYLKLHLSGSSTEEPDTFYGYYTIHVLRDGKVYGMLSVNGYTGQVWYHTWHGAFIQMKELT
jgi:hypothetical protein